MKAGQIVKVTPKALKQVRPWHSKSALRVRSVLWFRRNMTCPIRLIKTSFQSGLRFIPSSVQFNELEDIMGCENNTIMLFP